LCTYRLPAHRKLLPLPCPQCQQEYGGCQFVIFNPKTYLERTGYSRDRYEPYCILRISHYSKQQYALSRRTKGNGKGKVWHNFQIDSSRFAGISRGGEHIPLNQIFNDLKYEGKQSINLPVSDGYFQYIKKIGWSNFLMTDRAHWVNRNKDLRKCQECRMYFPSRLVKRFNYPAGFFLKYSWLCQKCYSVDLERVADWKKAQNKPLIIQ
jgi:hypothetical protein